MNLSWLLDLDGVLWRGGERIEGAAEAVGALRDAGIAVTFFTNNSFPLLEGHLAKLESMGVPAAPEEVLTSAQAAAGLLQPGARALVVGGPGIRQALAAAGVVVVPVEELTVPGIRGPGMHASGDPGGLARLVEELDALEGPEVDAVVVGIDPRFDFARLVVATRAVARGARLVATNDDATYPTPRGFLPGAGSVVAAIASASGTVPVVAGKPYEPAGALIRQRFGASGTKVGTVVGDRPETDGLLARLIGARFALVLSGVTPAGHGALVPEADVEAASLAELVARELGC